MRIRTYAVGDLARLQEITVQAFEGVSIDRNIEREFGRLGSSSWQERKAEQISQDVEANPNGVFVAEEAGQIVGYLTTRIDRGTRVGRIPNLAVDEQHRGKGIAKALFSRAFHYFKEEGMLYSKIEALEQNEIAVAFYPRLGYEEVARQVHYFMKLG
jgi:ribosomal protein S18 acetylase RimI-like enzyme